MKYSGYAVAATAAAVVLCGAMMGSEEQPAGTGGGGGPNADPIAAHYTDEMQQALTQLPDELRETLLLVVVGELTHQEVADLMEIPLGTVLSRVSRARRISR